MTQFLKLQVLCLDECLYLKFISQAHSSECMRNHGLKITTSIRENMCDCHNNFWNFEILNNFRHIILFNYEISIMMELRLFYWYKKNRKMNYSHVFVHVMFIKKKKKYIYILSLWIHGEKITRLNYPFSRCKKKIRRNVTITSYIQVI